MDPWLDSFIRSYGAACPSCRRPLSASPLCPHCRVPLRLGVKVREIYLLAWGVTLASSGIVAGCGLLLLFCVWRRPFLLHRADTPEFYATLGVCVLGVLLAIATTLLIPFRRRFCGLARSAQWILAASALALMVTCLAAAGLFVR